jgi:hypothetical protein
LTMWADFQGRIRDKASFELLLEGELPSSALDCTPLSTNFGTLGRIHHQTPSSLLLIVLITFTHTLLAW